MNKIKKMKLSLCLIIHDMKVYGDFFIIGEVGLSPWYCGHSGLLYKPQMIDEVDFWSN
jgi:hypothetical protein